MGRVRFGEFVLDGEARVLARGRVEVAVSPKVFQLLQALLAARPRVLGRAELNDLLWPSMSVGYTSLASAIADLRRLLGDDRKAPRFIRTVRGFGYAFCAQVTEMPEGAGGARFACALFLDGHEVALIEGENVIGRDECCAIRIDRPTISRRHACVLVQDGEATLEDLGSKNGTLLRGRRLREPLRLEDGDEISFGTVALTFRASAGAGSTATADPLGDEAASSSSE